MQNDFSQFSNDPSEPAAPWFQVPRDFIRNPKLSFESKGVMTYLMSHSGNWHISIPYIIKTQNISKDRIYKIINECIENGYLKRESYFEKGLRRFKYLVSPTGRFKKCLPCPENPDLAEPDLVNPDTKLNQSSSSEEEKIDQLEEHSLSYSLSKKEEGRVCFGTHLKLKKEDYENFCNEYGKQNIDSLIEEMNDWITSRGKDYKDYAAELRNWIRRRNWNKVVFSNQIETVIQDNVHPLQKRIDENSRWTETILKESENSPYYESLRILLFHNRIEVPELTESTFYYDSPGFKSCFNSVLTKLKNKDYTKKFEGTGCGVRV